MFISDDSNVMQLSLFTKPHEIQDTMNRGLIGNDWMPYTLRLRILGIWPCPDTPQGGPPYIKNGRTITCTLRCQTYLTGQKRFSLGQKPLKWIQRSDQFIHDSRDSVLKEIKHINSKPQNYIKFWTWYRGLRSLDSWPYYVDDPRYDHNWFYLGFTDAMINRIHWSLSLADGNLWIDHVNWSLKENIKIPTESKNTGEDGHAELPGEVWTS